MVLNPSLGSDDSSMHANNPAMEGPYLIFDQKHIPAQPHVDIAEDNLVQIQLEVQ